MASLLPTLSSPPRLLQPRARRSPTIISAAATPPSPFFSASSLTQLDLLVGPLTTPDNKQEQQKRRLPKQDTPQGHHHNKRDEFYLNLGTAVRTLRDDLPVLFSRDLNYDIYRDDITFADPLNTFQGIDNYRRIFWALRFHGRILFREIGLDVLRIWQISDDVILIRWNLKGVPRVPWEARGHFQGTSRYKLDRRGKIYEHRVDNLAFNLPKMAPAAGSAALLDLVAASACPPMATASPGLRFLPGPSPRWWDLVGDAAAYECSWVEFYRAVKHTVVEEGHPFVAVAGIRDGLVSCS